MPFELPLQAEGNPEALRHVESFHAPPEAVNANVHAQLTNPQDIASAHQFFRAPSTGQFLPPGHVGAHGIELGSMTPAGKLAVPSITGMETHALAMPPGGEMAALSGAPGVMPGAEQISPLINMIMKMPGHISLVSSFFECLGAFLAPAQEMLGHLVEGLDVGALFEHAGSATEALSGVLESAGEHVSVDLSLLPTDAPIFDQIGQAHGLDFAPNGPEQMLGADAPHLNDSFASAPRLEVGGHPNHPLFEMGSGTKGFGFEGNQNYLAMEPNRGFGATVGNYSPPTAAPVQSVPQPSLNDPAQMQSPAGHGHSSALDFRKEALSSSREHLLGHNGTDHAAANHASAHHAGAHHAADHHAANQGDAGAAKHASPQAGDAWQAQPASQSSDAWQASQAGAGGDRLAEVQSDGKVAGSETYTVHRGDNLWDIAKDHLGDGNRWHEIYDLNHDVLGDNPRLIMPGTELHLPGEAIASGASGGGLDYTVHAGDNLWNISQEHLGGGQNWHSLYQGNESVIGSDPAMIHPGQHLHLDAGAQGGSEIAGNHAASHQSLASNHHHAASHASSHHHGQGHVAQHEAPAAHNSVAQQSAPANHNSVAQTGSPAQSAPPAQPVHDTTGGMKAQAQSISSSQSYGDGSGHLVDSSARVPNTQP